MLAGSDEIKIFSLNLVHHGIHLCKTHNTCNHITADHERRYTVSKSTVNHEISCIGDNCGMKSCNISHQIIESISCHSSGTVKINTIETLHNLGMIRNFKIRNYRLTVSLYLYVLSIILSNRNARINDVRNGHHDLGYFLIQFFFFYRQFFQFFGISCNLFFYRFCLFLFALTHQSTNLFGNFVLLTS